MSIYGSMRREIERAIHEALNPTGMAIHSGMARINVATLQRLVVMADKAEAAVLAEREACAEVLVGKIKRHEQIAQECALRGEYDEVTGLRSTARKLSECVAEIRARGKA